MSTRRDQQKRQIQYSSAKKWAESAGHDSDDSGIRLPDGVSWFNVKDRVGNYKIDIIPFIAGKGNPNAAEGYVHYERTYYVHYGFGVDRKVKFLCGKTFGKPCAVCNYLDRNRTKLGEDFVKDHRAKTRMLWCLIDRSSADAEAKGIQVWDTAYYKSFGQKMKDKITTLEDYETFFHLAGGYTLILQVAKESMGDGTFNAVTNIEMVPRKHDLPESLLDEAPCLDKLLVEAPYKEVEKRLITLVEGGDEGPLDDEDDDAEEAPEPPRPGGRAPAPRRNLVEEPPADEDDFVDDEEDPDPPPRSRRAGS